MKNSIRWAALSALVLAASSANAQAPARGGMPAPYMAVSDIEGPYGDPAPRPRYGYERGPTLLPEVEVYTVLRENGFSPVGAPRLRGFVYTISAVNRRGDDGRLVIDARDGRIVRFVRAYGIDRGYEGEMGPYGARAALLPPTVIRAGVPRPPAPIPHVASRAVPLPKAAPRRGEVSTALVSPAPSGPARRVQHSAATQARPAPSQPAAPAVTQAKPAPTILPTEQMPPVQGLE